MAIRWSDLPAELLDLILQKLQLPDCVTFMKVCQTWRSVFLSRRCLPPPCMVLTPLTRPEESGLIYSLHGGKILKLRASSSGIQTSGWIVGSSMGWLMIRTYNRNIMRLFNPITGDEISIPWLNKYRAICAFTLSSDPRSGDCILVLRGRQYDNSDGLAWCRPETGNWEILKVPEDQSFGIKSVVFHKDKFWILNDKGDLYTFVSGHWTMVAACGSIYSTTDRSHWSGEQLVCSGDELLLVVLLRKTVKIFRQAELGGWVKTKSLGNWSLLVSEHEFAQSFCTLNLMGSGFEGNCAYFSDFNGIVKFSIADRASQKIIIPLPPNWRCYCHRDWILPQTW